MDTNAAIFRVCIRAYPKGTTSDAVRAFLNMPLCTVVFALFERKIEKNVLNLKLIRTMSIQTKRTGLRVPIHC